MLGELDHLRWKRLEIESPLKPRNPPPPPRPRSDRNQHVQELDSESVTVVETLRQNRRRQGIDPNRLLVLRMRFLDETRRDLLAKLELSILDEREEREPLVSPIFELQVEFPNSAAAVAIRQWPNLLSFGITGIQPELGPGGTTHSTRLVLW